MITIQQCRTRNVYKEMKDTLDKEVQPKDCKPVIYAAIRKNIFGDNTKMEPNDFVKHIVVKDLD